MKKLALAAASTLLATGVPSYAQDTQTTSTVMAESYERSKTATLDAYITGRLITAYALTEQLETADIHVFVHHREAILTGIVKSPIQKELAIEIAHGVPGLDEIESDLVIEPQAHIANQEVADSGFTNHFRNAAMKARIKTRLMWNKHVSGLSIDVIAEQGEITLLGAVDSAEQAALAEAIAENTEGVIRVDNKLNVQTASRS